VNEMSPPAVFQNAPFGPAAIGRMVAAYEAALRVLNFGEHSHDLKEIVAAKIMESARWGERDPARMMDHALTHFGVYRDDGRTR
jgi:hypothetical protein